MKQASLTPSALQLSCRTRGMLQQDMQRPEAAMTSQVSADMLTTDARWLLLFVRTHPSSIHMTPSTSAILLLIKRSIDALIMTDDD